MKNLSLVFAKVMLMTMLPVCSILGQVSPSFCEKQVPNIITPNDDNLNDNFCLPCDDLSKWHLKICNRWGKVIYENTNYKNEWDGGSFSAGVYFYRLENSTLEKVMNGWVTILK